MHVPICYSLYVQPHRDPFVVVYIINTKQQGARLQGNMEDSSCMSVTAIHATRIQSIFCYNDRSNKYYSQHIYQQKKMYEY